MARMLNTPDVSAMDAHYVEVVGPDGLMHHVGPFNSVAGAEGWIAQHSPGQAPNHAQAGRSESRGRPS